MDVYQAFANDLQDFAEVCLNDDLDFQAAVSEIPEMSPKDMEEFLKNGR